MKIQSVKEPTAQETLKRSGRCCDVSLPPRLENESDFRLEILVVACSNIRNRNQQSTLNKRTEESMTPLAQTFIPLLISKQKTNIHNILSPQKERRKLTIWNTWYDQMKI